MIQTIMLVIKIAAYVAIGLAVLSSILSIFSKWATQKFAENKKFSLEDIRNGLVVLNYFERKKRRWVILAAILTVAYIALRILAERGII